MLQVYMMKHSVQTDIDSLDLLQLKALSESVGSRPRLIEKWARALSFSPYIAFAEKDGALIGFGRVESDGTIYLIYDMFVQPAMQGKGVGSLILQSLLEQARAGGVKLVGLSAWTPMARKFYLKHGFKDAQTSLELHDYMEIYLPKA